jgi:hypothetical protein
MRYKARKFVQASYDRNDDWGKEVLVRWLNMQGGRFTILEKDKEDYKVDILALDLKADKLVAFEVEVKHGYPFTDEASFKFDSVSFLGRKKKYGDFWYVIVCAETEAILIAHSFEIYKEEYREIKTIATNERNGLDEFYRLPKSKCLFYANTRTPSR